MDYVDERIRLANTDVQIIAGLNGRILYTSDLLAIIDDLSMARDLLDASGIRFIPTAGLAYSAPLRADRDDAAAKRAIDHMAALEREKRLAAAVPKARAAPKRAP